MIAVADAIDDGATRTRIVTYLHEFSHNEEADISKNVPRPEAARMLATVFELMNEVDGKHFDSMCASLKIDASQLLLFINSQKSAASQS